MNKTIKKNWITALRSGQYEQTQGALCRADHDKDRYCCLGVLIDIEYNADWTLSEDKDRYYIDNGNGASLPPSMMTKLSISTDQQQKLMQLNDGVLRSDGQRSKKQTFNQIADWISTHL